jgi:predicted DNA-binding protein
MPQITTSVGDNTIEELKKIAEKTEKSFSKIVCEIIELGLKINKMQGENKQDFSAEKKTRIEQKTYRISFEPFRNFARYFALCL